jgi:hypothetical protein
MGATQKQTFQLDLAFFGLTSEIAKQFRVNLFIQIHEIVFHGQGGYDWETVYNMPIWLRKFTFHQMKEHYKEKNGNENSDLDAQTSAIKTGKVQIPDQFKGKLANKAPKY